MLKGAVFFLSDLMRHLEVDCEVDFMAVSSYGSSTDSSGVVRILKDLDASIEGRDVLIVEDIVDSGLTLAYLFRMLRARGPASLEVCALLTKPGRREIDMPIRYVGFEIPNRFADWRVTPSLGRPKKGKRMNTPLLGLRFTPDVGLFFA